MLDKVIRETFPFQMEDIMVVHGMEKSLWVVMMEG